MTNTLSAEEIRIFTKEGIPLADLFCTVSKSWILDGTGRALFLIAKTDPLLTEELVRYGNLVLIEHSTAGRWGGVIWTPRQWGRDHLEVVAYGPEQILSRRADTTAYSGTAGSIFQDLIDAGNSSSDMQIETGDIYSGGESFTENDNHDSYYDIINRMARRTGQDWSMEPALRSNGRLYFVAQWHSSRGTIWDQFTLEEGVHLKEPDSFGLIEQGDIINDLALQTYTGSASATASDSDETSQSTYGLSQGAITQKLPSGFTPATYVSSQLEFYKNPRRTFPLRVIDLPGLSPDQHPFTYLGLGDRVGLSLVRYGFTTEGLGLETTVRVKARELRLEDGFMSITVEE